MYLKKLYNTNKWWFALILLFIIIQLAMDIRQDIDISPVYHYGMYSEVMLPQKQYSVTQIAVNGTELQTKDFSPYEWDKIKLPVELFSKQQDWNTYVYNNEVKRLLHINDSTKYVNNISQQQFIAWYKTYLQNMLREKVDSVKIDHVVYEFDGNNLIKKAG